VKGLTTRGGFVVDVAWDKGQLARVILHPGSGHPIFRVKVIWESGGWMTGIESWFGMPEISLSFC
jgi:hypothetical protein